MTETQVWVVVVGGLVLFLQTALVQWLVCVRLRVIDKEIEERFDDVERRIDRLQRRVDQLRPHVG